MDAEGEIIVLTEAARARPEGGDADMLMERFMPPTTGDEAKDIGGGLGRSMLVIELRRE